MAEIQQELMLSSSTCECCHFGVALSFLHWRWLRAPWAVELIVLPSSASVLQCSDILISCLVLPWRPPVWDHNHLFVKNVVEKTFLKRISSYTLCFLAFNLLFHATEGEGEGIWSTIKLLPLWGRLRLDCFELLMTEVIYGLPHAEEICLTFSPDTPSPYEEIMYHIRECSICDLFKECSRKGERESSTSGDVFKASATKIILRIRRRFT